jgi:hypothetical protein
MSGYRAHMLFYSGLVLCYVLLAGNIGAAGLSGLRGLAGAAVGAFYSVLPDIDSYSSKSRRIFTWALVVSLSSYLLLGANDFLYASLAVLALAACLAFTRHRGIFHTPSAAVAMSAPLLLYDGRFFAMALLGYASHLALDGRLFK